MDLVLLLTLSMYYVGICFTIYWVHSWIEKYMDEIRHIIENEIHVIRDDVNDIEPGLVLTKSGWVDKKGHINQWNDVASGLLMTNVLITAYKMVKGEPIRRYWPAGQTISTDDGNWIMLLSKGEYEFHFYKDSETICVVDRKVGD